MEAPTAPPVPPPGALRALWRGARRRCPRCGGGGLFRGRFHLRERCPRCGLGLHGAEGGFLGALTLNYAVTALVWLGMLVAVLVATVPDVPVGPLMAASGAVVVAVPIAFYPFSRSLWAAVEYLAGSADEGGDRPEGSVPIMRGSEAP
ncbi:MAG TPA: DUF983 domain-containing protein [Actinomycetota bacterium]|nr:DUF983 domain-containing protein [Actinomycetota bacterium]